MAPMWALLLMMVLAKGGECRPVERGPEHPLNVTVQMKSEMGAGTTLGVFCVENWQGYLHPQRNYGHHQLANDERYSFVVVQPFPPAMDRQIYTCYFTAKGFPQTGVAMYLSPRYPQTCLCAKQSEYEILCPLWTVNPKGFFCGSDNMTTWGRPA